MSTSLRTSRATDIPMPPSTSFWQRSGIGRRLELVCAGRTGLFRRRTPTGWLPSRAVPFLSYLSRKANQKSRNEGDLRVAIDLSLIEQLEEFETALVTEGMTLAGCDELLSLYCGREI